jgi:hypothetical protein
MIFRDDFAFYDGTCEMHFEAGAISGPLATFMNSYIDDRRHLLGSIVGRIHRRDTQDHIVLDRLNRASSIHRI